jgi:symplekin
MNGAITEFARRLLKRLEDRSSADESMNDALDSDIPRYLPPKLELPAKKSEVIQHVELMFALSVRVPTFLDE